MQKTNTIVCAVITEESVEAAQSAIHLASTQADMIEVRLDYLRDFDFHSVESLGALLKNRLLPTILTCRSVEEGGKQYLANSIRLPLLIEGAKRFAEFCDIEAAHYQEAIKLLPDLSKLIISYHNFNETPEEIEEIYEQVTSQPARIHKIAVRANHLSDTLPIFHLLERAQQENRTVIAIAMQEAGLITRVIGCSRGSFLTYGALEEAKQSAPGQLSCSELKNLYQIHNLSTDTQITGLIGKPVSHSLSPTLHNSMFAALNLDAVYLPL